jgi:quercetin 2,3-dioxygenase
VVLRHGYLVPSKGVVEIDGVRINARDGATIGPFEKIRVTAREDVEIILVDAV